MKERPDESLLIARAESPVLDVGCGPGRHVAELAARGMITLGIDVSPSAVQLAHERGAPALCRSIFERVPAIGRWATILLIDGNIGIGGDPVVLLQRCAELLQPGGKTLVELQEPGQETKVLEMKVVAGSGSSAWFEWARVSVDDIEEIARRATLKVSDVWTEEGRWFASLVCREDSSTHPSP